MTQPRITVVTTNLNRSDYLEQTLCSVLDQGYDNLEYIVIDAGSTDGSVDVIRRYEDDLDHWSSVPDRGPASGLNMGLACATGDIVGVVHAGDLLLPGSLHEVAKAMTGRDSSDWVVGNCRHIGPRDEDRGAVVSESPASSLSFLMHDSGVLPMESSFWRMSLFEKFGGFDADLRYAYDYEFACRLMMAGRRPSVIGHTLTLWRELEGRTTAARALQRGMELIDSAHRHGGQLPLPERYALWRNLEARRRIYTLAEAEARDTTGRRYLAQKVLRHPWWLADDAVRQMLLRGVDHPLPSELSRPAA